MSAKIGEGKHAELVRRFLNITGTLLAPFDEVAPELTAALILESDRPEWEFLRGVRYPCAAGLTFGAGVAQQTKWRLRNPTNSGIIGVVEAISGQVIQTTRLLAGIQRTTTNANSVATSRVLDSRWPSTATPSIGSALVFSGQNTALADLATTITLTDVPANTHFNFERRALAVITPGFALDVATDVAVAATCAFLWREKPSNPAELAAVS